MCPEHSTPQPPGPRRAGQIRMHPLAAADAAPFKPDTELIESLERSFVRLKPRGAEFVNLFYNRLFAEHPYLRGMFPSDMAAQEAKLLESLKVVIAGLRDPAAVRDRLHTLGTTHAEKGVRNEQYPIVCRCMLGAMAELLGPEWNQTLEQNWSSALDQISRLMIEGGSTQPAAAGR